MIGGVNSRRRLALWGGTAFLAMAAHPALAQDASTVTAAATIREVNRYPVRLMLSTFDGTREFSHTQVATIGRMRQGDESWVEVDFGNGAVHIENEDRTQLGRFRNVSGVEQGMHYDYSTGLMTGDPAVAQFHNLYVQPLLGHGPELGGDAHWTRSLMLGGLGFATLRGSPFEIQFERRYFTHAGKRYAFVRYVVPSFTYTANGTPVVMWGEGAAITDETMGELYWNAALHRAVAQERGATGRPYRYAKTIAALDAAGEPVFDPRDIPEVAPFVDRFYGAAATQVMPFSDSPPPGGSETPLVVFAKLDTVAISVAENSANQAGELTAAYTDGSTGAEQLDPYQSPRAEDQADALGADAYSSGSTIYGDVPEPTTLSHEAVQVLQGSGSATTPLSPEVADALANLMASALATLQSSGTGGTTTSSQMLTQLETIASSQISISQTNDVTAAQLREGLDRIMTSLEIELAAGGDGLSQMGQASALMNVIGDTLEQVNDQMLNIAQAMGSGGGGGAAEGAGGGGAGGGGGELADVVASVLGTTFDGNDKLIAIAEGILSLQEEAAGVYRELTAATDGYAAAKEALDAMTVPMELSQEASALKALYESQRAELARLNAMFDDLQRLGIEPAPGLIADYQRLGQETLANGYQLKNLLGSPAGYVAVPTPAQLAQAARVQQKLDDIAQAEMALVAVYNKASQIQDSVRALSQTDLGLFVKALADSPLGKVVSGVASGLNVASTLGSISNVSQLQNNLASGDLQLSRSYGTSGSVGLLAFDLLALTGNGLSGNVVGALLDAAAIGTGSLTDIIIAGKALKDINQLERETTVAAYTNELALIDRRLDQFEDWIASLETDLAEARDDIQDIEDDEAAAIARERLAEIEARRQELARLEHEAELAAEAERQRLIEEARAENERRYQEWLKRPPTPEEWAQFNEDIAEAIKPDYPTAPPPTPEQLAARLREAEARRQAELEELAAAAAAEAEAALAAAAAEAERQRQLALTQEEAVRKREEEALAREAWLEEARNRGLDVSELDVSEFDIEPVEFAPVVFEPPVWEPPVWEPPVWVPPEFDPPEASEIPWTDFDDDDWLLDTGNLAYDYEGMSGIVATDLSRWAEWLATQDIRKLERLALLAGYPNLASALADAYNIIRQSQDDGYRQWAMTAPSCGGYVGCGPSYLERWQMKLAIVQLGDILAQSRDIFSSGGFTDIGISTLNLSYLLRDHSLEDGDIVRIRIQQFGRVIYEAEVNLTNAGQDFTQNLHPGVASLEIYAVNEGYSPPNTAQIRIDDVVQGEDIQTYQLRTGETATLRIENNAGR